MFSNSYIKASYAFTIIGFIAESTLKFIDDTRCKFLGNTIFKTKSLCKLQILFKSQNELEKAFRFKELITKQLTDRIPSLMPIVNLIYY